MYRQVNERAGIAIEQGTDSCPNDDRFYVFKDGEIVKGFNSLKQANVLYKKLVDEKNLPPLEKGQAKKTMKDLVRSDWDLRSNKSLLGESWTPKGKKSGRYHKSR